jgi:hypothetical protein
MAHNRKLVLSGIAMTMARIPSKRSIAAMTEVRDQLEQEMINSGYIENAPFRWIGLSIRKGLADENEPHYHKIDSKDGELPLAIEIDTHRLLNADDEQMAAVYRKATLIALVHAGEKYKLPVDRLRLLLEDV